MDEIVISSDDSALDIFDIKNVNLLLSSCIVEETEFVNMTSLENFMFFSQHEKSSNIATIDDNSLDKTRLSLAYERMHNMPKILLQELAPHIKILDISHNEFDKLNFMTEFKEITSLICDHNNITSSTQIPSMPKLELLWLNNCKINELYPWARKLQSACPELKYLSLMGNPAAPSYLNGGNFYEYLHYRLFMISLFPKLIHLDDKIITIEQREEANRIYKKPLIKRIVTNGHSKLPDCIKTVSGKVADILSPPFISHQKNIII